MEKKTQPRLKTNNKNLAKLKSLQLVPGDPSSIQTGLWNICQVFRPSFRVYFPIAKPHNEDHHSICFDNPLVW